MSFTGILHITEVRGKDLAAEDVTGSSDPYFVIKYVLEHRAEYNDEANFLLLPRFPNGVTFKSRVIDANLNPIWHEMTDWSFQNTS